MVDWNVKTVKLNIFKVPANNIFQKKLGIFSVKKIKISLRTIVANENFTKRIKLWVTREKNIELAFIVHTYFNIVKGLYLSHLYA